MKDVFARDGGPPHLILGTAQLGMAYRLDGGGQKPDRDASFGMLEHAHESGINILDTASAYGDAEKIIGDYSRLSGKKFSTITKLRVDVSTLQDRKKAREEIYSIITSSTERLGEKPIPACLYHKGPDDPPDVLLDRVAPIFSDLKREGFIGLSGFSAYFPSDVDFIHENHEIDVVQVPFNVLDHRALQNGRLDRLKRMGTAVLSRSVFLKGLLFLEANNLTGTLLDAAGFVASLKNLADKYQMSVAQVAFSFVRDTAGISGLVFGAENVEQIEENIRWHEGPPLPPELRSEIERNFEKVPDIVVTPGMW